MKGPAASRFASAVEGWQAGMKTKQKLFEVGFAPLASSQRGVPTKLVSRPWQSELEVPVAVPADFLRPGAPNSEPPGTQLPLLWWPCETR